MSDWNFKEIETTIQQEAALLVDAKGLEDFRIKYLGRKGLLAQIYAGMGQASPEERPHIGKSANTLKVLVEGIVAQKKQSLDGQSRQALTKEKIDVTLPGIHLPLGHQHILTQMIDEICGIFESMGFVVQEGPEIETEFNNFEALNIPIDHPSRDAFDTFYVDTKGVGQKRLLRSHTSPAQIRMMQNHKPPFAVIIPGKVYRPDKVDATHSSMFHQIEGLLVDKDVKFSDLKGLVCVFCQKFFGEKVKMRFRPHFFPFTEPSAEVDIYWKKGWLEIMGCGMVHPKVFAAVDYPKGKYTGLAFGMGIERMVMLKYGIHDIRYFFENDVRFLRQF